MKNLDKKFFICEGFCVNKFIEKNLFFYHLPKCAGTTLVVILSHLFKKSFRLKGVLFENNDKGEVTGFQYFQKNKSKILEKNYNFVFGHVPINIHKYFEKDFFFCNSY